MKVLLRATAYILTYIGVTTCTTGDIRQVLGHVEVCIANVWGTVCSHGFNTRGYDVLCAQLGYPRSGCEFAMSLFPCGCNIFSRAVSSVVQAQGSGQIWLSNVECAGSEARLVDCPADPPGQHSCSHSEDIGVTCSELAECDGVAL